LTRALFDIARAIVDKNILERLIDEPFYRMEAEVRDALHSLITPAISCAHHHQLIVSVEVEKIRSLIEA
jgi:ABC-type thiamine transport system ATPase subunit